MFRVCAQPLKNPEPGHAGHFEIYEDNIGHLAIRFVEGWLALQIRDDFAAVPDDLKRTHLAATFEAHLKEFNVGKGVFRQKNIQLPLVAISQSSAAKSMGINGGIVSHEPCS